MLDHVNIRVAEYDRSKKFYEAALAPLGYTLAMENASGAGFRKGFIPDFWIKQGEATSSGARAEPSELPGCGGPPCMSHLQVMTAARSMLSIAQL